MMFGMNAREVFVLLAFIFTSMGFLWGGLKLADWLENWLNELNKN